MVRKHIDRLAIVGGAHAGTISRRAAAGLGIAGLFARMLRALSQQRIAPRSLHAVPSPVVADSLPLYEQHFASERAARAFADGLAAEGTRAEVIHDLYDFSWSVEVHGSERLPRHEA